jgi:hypothetical protein
LPGIWDEIVHELITDIHSPDLGQPATSKRGSFSSRLGIDAALNGGWRRDAM